MALKAIIDKIDELPEDIKKEYVEKNGKFELQVEGMKTQADVDRLQGALIKERNDHKTVRERLGLLGDRKIEDVLQILDRVPELEAAAAGKIDENKLNEIVEGRIKTRIAPLEREKGQLAQKVQDLSGVLEQYKTKEKVRTIHDAVREAVGKAQGFQSSAVEDALLYAERMLEVGEDGRVTTRDGVGVTPGIDAAVWLSEMQAKKAHWWGPSQGGGAGGNRNGAGTGGNPWSADNWNMTEQGRILKENRSRAEQLAKSAGTSIGGPRPQSRK
jgi:hypothetical protein